MVARLLWLPLATLSAVLLYQTTNAAVYYLIGCGVYFWAYSEGEVCSLDNGCERCSLGGLLTSFGDYRLFVLFLGLCLRGRIGELKRPMEYDMEFDDDDTICFFQLHSVGPGVSWMLIFWAGKGYD